MAIDFSKFALGASGTNLGALSPKIGALAPYIQLMEQIYPQTALYTPEEQAFLFFTKMAEESSKPGATAIGAAGAAGTELMKTKLASKTLEQQRAGNIITGAVGLSSAMKQGKPSNVMVGQATYLDKDKALQLYPEKDFPGLAAQFVATGTFGQKEGDPIVSAAGSPMLIYHTYQNGVHIGTKLLPQGEIIAKSTRSAGSAIFVKEEDAKDYIKNTLGITEDHTSYQRVLDKIVPTNPVTQEYEPDRVGKSIITNQKFGKWTINEGNNQIVSVILEPDDKAGKPMWIQYTEKRLNYIASHLGEVKGKVLEIVPLLENPMEQLLSGATKTGAQEAILLPWRQLKQSVFNVRDEQGFIIDNLQTQALLNLQSLSFKLAPLMRPKGSGSTSDMEFKAYQKAILDLKNTPQTNYLNLYALERVSKIAEELLDTEMNLLSEAAYSIKEVNERLAAIDPGIYPKYTGPINTKQIMDANPGMTEDKAREYLLMYREEFIINLPRGDVVITPPEWMNRTKDTRQKKENQILPFYIQGWGFTSDKWRELIIESKDDFKILFGDLNRNINQPWDPEWSSMATVDVPYPK
jgi:hypothetical protein